MSSDHKVAPVVDEFWSAFRTNEGIDAAKLELAGSSYRKQLLAAAASVGATCTLEATTILWVHAVQVTVKTADGHTFTGTTVGPSLGRKSVTVSGRVVSDNFTKLYASTSGFSFATTAFFNVQFWNIDLDCMGYFEGVQACDMPAAGFGLGSWT